MISATLYLTIANIIDSAQLKGVSIVAHIDQMSINLINSEIPSTDLSEMRLERQIIATSSLLDKRHDVYTPQMLGFVFRLQTYIDDNYSTIDDFLGDNNIQVKSIFADISDKVGFPIDPSHIVSPSE